MGITIRKMKQPADGFASGMKQGTTFYRVKRYGENMQDFKTKAQAKRYVKKIK